MKSLMLIGGVVAMFGGIVMMIAGGEIDGGILPKPLTTNSQIARQAMVNNAQLMADEYAAAATLTDLETAERLKERLPAIREATLVKDIGTLLNKYEYGPDTDGDGVGDGEFDQKAHEKVFKEISEGLKSIK